MIKMKFAAACLLVPFSLNPALAGDCPDTLRIMAPATPGGGYDQTARALQQVITEAGLSPNVQVFNVPGAGGTLGLVQLATQSRGDGGTLMVTANVMIGAILTNKPDVTLLDTKPVSRLTSEYEAIVVPADSPIKNIGELIEKLKANPGAVSWGGGSAGGTDHMTAALMAKASGVDPKKVNYIAFSGGGEALASILGGSVTVGINTLSEFKDQIESGALRLLATTGTERAKGFDAPTLKESGLDVDTQTWRMVAAAPGVSDEDYAKLNACVAKAISTDAWKKSLASHNWTESVLTGNDLTAFVQSETDTMSSVLHEIGFIQ